MLNPSSAHGPAPQLAGPAPQLAELLHPPHTHTAHVTRSRLETNWCPTAEASLESYLDSASVPRIAEVVTRGGTFHQLLRSLGVRKRDAP